jgi:hypothetical protein
MCIQARRHKHANLAHAELADKKVPVNSRKLSFSANCAREEVFRESALRMKWPTVSKNDMGPWGLCGAFAAPK